jgi:hypothetical protein
MLQTASGETLPNLKEALVELMLGQEPHVNLGAYSRDHEQVYVLCTYYAFVDLGCHMLCLGQEEVSLWSPQVWLVGNDSPGLKVCVNSEFSLSLCLEVECSIYVW